MGGCFLRQRDIKTTSADLLNLNAHTMDYYEGTREDMLCYIPHTARATLDVGCGTGNFSELVKRSVGAEVWGVEMCREAAEQAHKKLDEVIIADVWDALPKIPTAYFDCVILFDFLEHLVDPYCLLTALKSKLTPTGVLVASIPNVRYYTNLKNLVIRGNWDYTDQGILDKTHLRFFTCRSITKVFKQLGYEIRTLAGIHPTSSRTFRILNFLLLNALRDVRYKHFVVVARPTTNVDKHSEHLNSDGAVSRASRDHD